MSSRSNSSGHQPADRDYDDLWEEQDPEETNDHLLEIETAISQGDYEPNEWEEEFLNSVREVFNQRRNHKERPLTGRQLAKIEQILKKVREGDKT